MQYFVGFFFLIVVLMRVCSSSANNGSRDTWHWQAAQRAAICMIRAWASNALGNPWGRNGQQISPYLTFKAFFLLPFPSHLHAEIGGDLTCLRVYANDSATINTGHPELPFCIYAHPIRHLLLLFQMVQKLGAGCRKSYKADVMWTATHFVSDPSLTSSMLLQTANFIFCEKGILQNVHHTHILQMC